MKHFKFSGISKKLIYALYIIMNKDIFVRAYISSNSEKFNGDVCKQYASKKTI